MNERFGQHSGSDELWPGVMDVGRLSDFFRSAADLFLIHQWSRNGRKSRLEAVNPAVLNALGLSEVEFAQLSPGELQETGILLTVAEAIELETCGTLTQEKTLVCQGGETRTFEVHTQLISFREHMRACSVARDITERKLLEEKLQAGQARFKSIVESVPDWIWEVDDRAVYTYAGPQVKALLGYDPSEVIGKTPWDLMTPEEARRVRANFETLRTRREPIIALKNTNIHKGGRLVALETSAVPLLDGDGQVTGYRGVDRDITKRCLGGVEEVLLAEQRDRAPDPRKPRDELLPICSFCNSIRAATGRWEPFERHSERLAHVQLTHGVCPECARKHYSEYLL